VAALGVLLLASTASAQYPARTTGTTFFPEIPVRAPVVFYPTLTLGGEYNDNVFLTSRGKQSDFIASVTPSLQLILERSTYRWVTGYSLTAEKYQDHSELDNAVQRQNFFISGSHQLTPRFTLTLSEVFIEDKASNLVGPESISIGRRTSRSNAFAPGFTWQFAPRTSLITALSYTLQRFDDENARASDVYRVTTDVRHEFTARLAGIVGFEGRYIDVEGDLGVTTLTPRLGATYRFTPALTGTVLVGPTVRLIRNEVDGVTPFAEANLTSLFSWGTASVFGTHYVGTAGGLGGTTENTSVGALVQFSTLLRDLVIEFGPRYSISKSVGGQRSAVDVRSLTADLRIAYRFTEWLAAVGGYRFFQQRSDSTGTTLAGDVDQQRAFLGVQFGYPFKFD
jgi:hypothetical protein